MVNLWLPWLNWPLVTMFFVVKPWNGCLCQNTCLYIIDLYSVIINICLFKHDEAVKRYRGSSDKQTGFVLFLSAENELAYLMCIHTFVSLHYLVIV